MSTRKGVVSRRLLTVIVVTVACWTASYVLAGRLAPAQYALSIAVAAALVNAVLGAVMAGLLGSDQAVPAAAAPTHVLMQRFRAVLVGLGIAATHTGLYLGRPAGARVEVALPAAITPADEPIMGGVAEPEQDTLEEDAVPEAILSYMRGLQRVDGTVLLEVDDGHYSAAGGRWLVLLRRGEHRSRTGLVWLNSMGQQVFEFRPRVDAFQAIFGADFDGDEALIHDVIAGDFLLGAAHPGPEIAILLGRAGVPVSCLEIWSLEGERLKGPLWSLGELRHLVYLSSDNLFIVAGVSPVLPWFVPELAEWDTHMRRSTLRVGKDPCIVFAVRPDSVKDYLPPLLSPDGFQRATVQWLLARVCDTEWELAEHGVNTWIDGIRPVDGGADGHAFDLVIATCRNIAPTVPGPIERYDIPMTAAGEVLAARSVSGFSHQTRAPVATLARIELAFLMRVVHEVGQCTQLAGEAEAVKQFMRRRQVIRGRDLDRALAMVDRMFSCGRFVNNAAWSLANSEAPEPEICRQWVASLNQILASPNLPHKDRLAFLNTIGVLLIKAGAFNEARDALIQSLRDGNTQPVHSIAPLVVVCLELRDENSGRLYAMRMYHIINSEEFRHDHFTRTWVQMAENRLRVIGPAREEATAAPAATTSG